MHVRLRVGNTKNGYLWPSLDFGSSQIVSAEDQIFLLGQTGLTLDAKGFVGENDIQSQVNTAIQNVSILLEEIGSRFNDVCMIHIYTTDA